MDLKKQIMNMLHNEIMKAARRRRPHPNLAFVPPLRLHPWRRVALPGRIRVFTGKE